MISRVVVVGTGLIGASVGLALKASGFAGEVLGWDASAAEMSEALRSGAIDTALNSRDAVLAAKADVYVLATPVLPILDWTQALAAVTGEGQLVTDVGSTKREIAAQERPHFCRAIRWLERSLVALLWRRLRCSRALRGCLLPSARRLQSKTSGARW